MNTYPATSILAGVPGSLKEIDPLDAVGDGTGANLVVGDRAWVPDYLGKMLFYSLEEEVGHSDDGEVEVIPENNPGIFYWKRQGYTKNTFSGAFAGEEFNAPSGSQFVPVGFVGGEMSYVDSSYQVYDPGFPDDNPPEYYASALYGSKIFVVSETDIYKMDRVTAQLTVTPHAGGGDWYWNPGHSDIDTSDTSKYLSHISSMKVDPVVLNRLNMDTEVVDSLSLTLPGGWDWDTYYGLDRTGNSVRIGNYHYLIGGHYTKRIGCSRIDVSTGLLEQLANVPGAGAFRGLCCPDFQNNCIYYHSEDYNAPLYRYNIDTDAHDTLWTIANGSYITEYITWFDSASNSIICSGYDLMIYDITLQTVTVYPKTLDTSNLSLYGGFIVFYESIGSFQFVAVEREYSPGFYDYPAAHIPAVNPLKIIKS